VEAAVLQRDVPFELDLDDGRAYVSLVAFTMCGMRPRLGGHLAEWLFKPIATHEFLNVRAYVRHEGEPGIYFLAEWLANPLSIRLGPATFGLPYRFARIHYDHQHERGALNGLVTSPAHASRLEYHAEINRDASFGPCAADSRDEFLMERYTAFTQNRSKRRFFRIWHPPWPQTAINADMTDISLLTGVWPWFAKAKYLGANYSPGVEKVWMGRPHRVGAEDATQPIEFLEH